jgi:Family of unknown function (DUF6325)
MRSPRTREIVKAQPAEAKMTTASPTSTTNHHDELGPIDIVVISYPPGARRSGEAAPLLMDLVDRGIIRVLDALFVTKAEDGSVAGFEAQDLDERDVGEFRIFEGASSGMLGDEDARTAAEALEPGTSAVIIVFENSWAAPFGAAVRRNGGIVVDYQRIPVDSVLAALDAADSAA